MLSISAGKFVEIGVTQFGGISALLRKQINNSKSIPQISTDFETVSQNNKNPNKKKPKENTIQNFFYRQLVYNSTQKYEDEVSQSNAEVLQSTTASKTLTNLSKEKNNKTERKLQGFFATKQKQMNCTKKDRNVSRDSDFQAKPSCNGQIQVVNSATMNSDLTVSRFFSKDCLEPENKAVTSAKNSNHFSESLVNNEDHFPGLKRKFPSRQRENNLDDCIILSFDNENSDVSCYITEASKSNMKNFQNLHVEVENATVGTVLCDNDCRKKLADDENGKVNGKSTNKFMNSKASAPNMYQNTVVKCIQENSDQLYCEEIDMNVACDRETKIDLLERPNSVKISNVLVSITSKNALAVCEEKQNIEGELSHSYENSKILSKNTFSSFCDTENKKKSFETLDYVTCKECLKKVLVWDFEEHQDFHFAQKLHKSVNAEANPVSNEVSCQSWAMKKRKSKTVYATHKKKTKTEHNMQTLELFFKK